MVSWEALGAIGAAGGAAAAWAGTISPWARSKRRAKKAEYDEDRRLKRETHEALYGIPEKRDDAGGVIKPAQPGFLSEFRVVRDDLKSLRAEFPVNGVPARAAIDVINQNLSDMRTDIKSLTQKVDVNGERLDEVETKVEALRSQS